MPCSAILRKASHQNAAVHLATLLLGVLQTTGREEKQAGHMLWTLGGGTSYFSGFPGERFLPVQPQETVFRAKHNLEATGVMVERKEKIWLLPCPERGPQAGCGQFPGVLWQKML